MVRYVAGENLPYFCTISVLDWLPVLIEARYIDPILESLLFCRQHKNLQIFGFVIMLNHIHLIVAHDLLHPLMRDFKRFTSRTIHDRLKEDGRITILEWLSTATQRARRERDELGLRQDGFHPQAIYSRSIFEQKLTYLHQNPVGKGLVRSAEDWWYSSAGFYAGSTDVSMKMDWLDM